MVPKAHSFHNPVCFGVFGNSAVSARSVFTAWFAGIRFLSLGADMDSMDSLAKPISLSGHGNFDELSLLQRTETFHPGHRCQMFRYDIREMSRSN